MAAPRYIYQRRGGPLVRWDHASGRPPGQTRAADASGLGSLGSTDVFDQPRVLPRPGAPEYIHEGLSGCGCGCGGSMCVSMGGVTSIIANPITIGALALGAFLLLRKKR